MICKERLMKEESFEEMCINEILPKPFHNKLSKIPFKHATQCLAAVTHYLLRKGMFDTKTSQAELAKEFAISEKNLYLVVSGRKYDPREKLLKQKSSEKPTPAKKKKDTKDEPKMDKVIKIQQEMEPNIDQQPSQQDLDEFSDDHDSLPDPFSQVDADMPELISD